MHSQFFDLVRQLMGAHSPFSLGVEGGECDTASGRLIFLVFGGRNRDR